MRRALAVYVIVEPAARNALQAVAGVAAISAGLVLLGAGLIAWAVLDAGIKASAGLLIWRREDT